jgi:putative zinc finger/helix-turn-helix YgiT family protein
MSELGKTFSECPACGEIAVSFREADISFPYGAAPDQVEIRARIPQGSCASCGFEFMDQKAEQLKHEAICQHFRLLTPKQIEALRKAWGMTRQQYAQVTKIGEASLARWERGVVLQIAAMDQFLYLLGFSDNMRRIRDREGDVQPTASSTAELSACFPNLKNPSEKQKEAERFHLRCVGA